MALQAADIDDLVNSTQADLGPGKVTDLTTDLQEHVAMSRLMQKERRGFDSGRAINVNTLMSPDNNARNVGLFSVDNVNQVDGTVVGNVPWRHSEAAFTYDVRQVAMNTGPAQIFDFVKTKRHQRDVALAALMEDNFWDEPNASTDTDTPFGLKYWLVYNATAGFNGGNNTNFSAGPAGIDRDTYARWKNYTFNYTAITKDDAITKMRAAHWNCQFKPAVPNPAIRGENGGNRYGIYKTYDMLSDMERIAEGQNDRLGFDMAPADGRVTFRRTTVEAVPYLQQNEATADPIVGINWGVFKVVFLRGRFMVDSPVREAPNQHNVRQAFTDISYNFVCYDPRRCFLGAKSTWH